MRVTRRGSLMAAVALLLFGGVGCDEVVAGDPLRIEASGVVQGAVFVDWNGNGLLDASDTPLDSLSVQVVQPGGGLVVASGRTDETGVYRIPSVPVGRLQMAVNASTLPDSLQVMGLSTAPFSLGANDTITRSFRTSFATHPLASIASLPAGLRVFTSGIVLNPRTPLGDGTVHVTLGGTYLRAIGVDNVAIAAGDSVRLQGRTDTEAGLPVLADVRVFVLRQLAAVPTVLERSTSVAAEAGSGALNGALVRVRNAEVLDTVVVNGDVVATVDDGSGPLDLLFRDYLSFDTDPLSPGFARVTAAAGLLVAEPPGAGPQTWRLLPRAPSDVGVEEFPLLTVQAVRALGSGVGVTARAVVLNPVDLPTPGTIHLRQQGFYIRVRGVTGAAFAEGDTVQVRGRTARDGPIPVLDALTVDVTPGTGVPPSPVTLATTIAAATGNGNGGADAALILLDDVPVTGTKTVDGSFVIVLDDGTGPVDVVTPAGYPTGGVVAGVTVVDEVSGFLIPLPELGTVRWRVHPVTESDIVLVP